MCAIFGSKDVSTLFELAQRNAYRGNFSWSLTTIDRLFNVVSIQQEFGEFAPTINPTNDPVYYIAHIQAPTGGLINDRSRIHPSIISEHDTMSMLWHNGIIKPHFLASVGYSGWDTSWLHHTIIEGGVADNLNNIDGSFSCVLFESGKLLQLFRNQSSPMFYSESGDISSTHTPITPNKTQDNVVYVLDPFEHAGLTEISTFSNINKPFFFSHPNN